MNDTFDSRADRIDPDSQILRSWLMATLVVVVVLSAVLAVVAGDFFTSFRLRGDDFAHIFYSSDPYTNISSWHRWFTDGFSQFYVNYPDWPQAGSSFSRPLVQLTHHIEGDLARRMGESAYLLPNYLILLVSAVMVLLIVRAYTDAGPLAGGGLAIMFGLSPVWYDSLLFSNCKANTLALMFALASLALMQPKRGVPGAPRLAGVVALQMAAVASHEEAVLVPLISVALLFAYSDTRIRIRDVVPFAVPFLLVVAQRLILQAPDTMYAFSWNLQRLFTAIKHFGVGPLLPIDSTRFMATRREMSIVQMVPYVFGIGMNYVLLRTLANGVLGRARRQQLSWVVVLGLAAFPGLFLWAEPRHMGLAFVLSLIALLHLYRERPAGARRILTLVALMQVLLFSAQFVQPQSDYIDDAVRSGRIYDALRASIQGEKPDTVVLASDSIGQTAARSMLRMATWPRRDVRLVVISNYVGPPDPQSRMSVARRGDELVFEGRYGPSQWGQFSMSAADFAIPNLGYRYQTQDETDGINFRSFSAVGDLMVGKTLVVGVDPRTGEAMEPLVFTSPAD